MKKNKRRINMSFEGIDFTFTLIMIFLIISVLKNIICIIRKVKYMKKVKKIMWLVKVMNE